jgi:DNA-binding NarL/FixJ family response regulator
MNSAKILVIEDEPQMLANLLTVLRAEKYTAFGAPDGHRGLELARREMPDVILCDITMPGLDGFGVLERLRSESVTAPVPFIFLTARGERTDVRAGMNLGADDYLTKPVRIDDLLAAIEARLTRQAQQDAAAGGGDSGDGLPAKPEELMALGLTAREADVLYWLIQGKSNADIGVLLEISPATVKKHLEHVFEKLGVENRTAATLAALEKWRKSR